MLNLLAIVPVLIGLAATPAAAEDSSGPCSPVAGLEAGEPIICTAIGEAGGQPLSVRLTWDILADTDELHITRVETATFGNAPAIAVFDDLDLRAPLSMGENGFEFVDFTFDGHMDFRLIEFLPAGPNAVYMNFFYDHEAGRHDVADSLNLLTAPEFDLDAETVISTWRSDAATHGRDEFAWDGRSLVLLKRTVTVLDAHGGCMMTAYEPRGKILAEDIAFAENPEDLLTELYEAPCE